MTKFDHRFQLPATLSERKLSILPYQGEVMFFPTLRRSRIYRNTEGAVEEFMIPSHIESIDFSTITSESLAINCAYVAGILSDFTQDENLLPTVSGRMSSQSFDFKN